MADVGVAHQRVSFADLERWPEDGRQYELYDGEVYVLPSPTFMHQLVSGELYSVFRAHGQTHGGLVLYSPLDIVLTEYDVVQPDLVFFTAERAGRLDRRKVIREAPDLAIEILSPSTASNDRGRKMQLLARHGVREYWLVNPDPVRIEIYVLVKGQLMHRHTASGDMLVRSWLLPQLSLRPIDLVPP
jgi:Uma2 family endonuclease